MRVSGHKEGNVQGMSLVLLQVVKKRQIPKTRNTHALDPKPQLMVRGEVQGQ